MPSMSPLKRKNREISLLCVWPSENGKFFKRPLLLLASECAIARLCIDNKIDLFHEPPESSMTALLILGYDVTSRPPWAVASLGYRFFLKSECGLARYSLPHAPSFVCVRPISTMMSHNFICLRRVTSHVIIQKVHISTVFVRCEARWLFQIITKVHV